MNIKILFVIVLVLWFVGCSKLDSDGSAELEKDTCASCHGLPPESGIHSLAQSNGYAYSCGECHNGYRVDSLLATNALLHTNGVVNVEYNSLPGMRNTMQGATCSNIACHGAAMSNNSGIVWNSNSNLGDTVGCQTCHSTGVGLVTGHRGGNGACFGCHSSVVEGTVDAMTIKDYTKHINGQVDF
ncbi:MAG: hypothetical protein OCD01_13125 [Fibrobacterales bacterium]